ncbi:MAG: P-loop NTPase [Spirochaetales bacterium]
MQIIPIASGKGGVGKSLVAANLAIALGKAGKDVVLIDLDLGASNLHLALGHQIVKFGIGTFLTGLSKFEDIIMQSGHQNVRFIPGDSEIPGLTALTFAQKKSLIKNFQQLQTDFLILDLGAGTHLSILDMFLLSPQGILVTAPTVTATLNGYLFLKNAVFRIMYNSFPKKSKAYEFIENMKSNPASLQRLYIPNLIDVLLQIDPENAQKFIHHMKQFRPRLIMNMIEDPKDADRAMKIRRSCVDYLGLDIDYLGVIFRDPMQDVALSSRLPITLYKPQSVLSQSVYRIADKILQSQDLTFADGDLPINSFENMESEAEEGYESKMSYIGDLIGSGALTTEDLADTIKAQQYEITQLKKTNLLLKSKILKAHAQGFTL